MGEFAAKCARTSARAPRLALALVLLACVLAGLGATRLRIDVSAESYLPESAPQRLALDEFRDRFGSTDTAFVTGNTGHTGSLIDQLESVEGVTGVSVYGTGLAVTSDASNADAADMTADRLRQIVSAARAGGADVQIAGERVNIVGLQSEMSRRMSLLIALSVLVTLGLVLVITRSLYAAIAALTVVVATLVSTFGLLGWAGIPLTSVTQILPSLLVTLSVADSMHLTQAFKRRRQSLPDEPVTRAISGAARATGTGLVLTTTTTAVGFASFCVAMQAPIVALGIAAPIGILLALAFTLTAVPALAALVPHRSVSRLASTREAPGTAPWQAGLAHWALRHRRAVLGAMVAAVLISSLGFLRLDLSQDALGWFPPDHELRTDTTAVANDIGGVLPVEIVIDTGYPGGAGSPEATAALTTARSVAGSSRIEGHGVHVLAEPPGPATDAEQRYERVTVLTPSVSVLAYDDYAADLRDRIAEDLPDGQAVEVAGVMAVLGAAFSDLLASLARSYLLALVLIAACLCLALRSVRAGVLALIPNLVPIVAVLGIAGFAGVPLDTFTLLAGTILLGVIVDDTIHMSISLRFGLDRAAWPRRTPDATVRIALDRAMASTGRSITATSLVLAGGFAVFAASDLTNLRAFGILCALGTAIALFADLVVLPALSPNLSSALLKTRPQAHRNVSAIPEKSPTAR